MTIEIYGRAYRLGERGFELNVASGIFDQNNEGRETARDQGISLNCAGQVVVCRRYREESFPRVVTPEEQTIRVLLLRELKHK